MADPEGKNHHDEKPGSSASATAASFAVAASDDVRLAEMGYKPDLARNFSLLSCLAVGFSVCRPFVSCPGDGRVISWRGILILGARRHRIPGSG